MIHVHVFVKTYIAHSAVLESSIKGVMYMHNYDIIVYLYSVLIPRMLRIRDKNTV